MSFKSLSLLVLLASAAVATVIKTNAEVTASINVQANSDQRNFNVIKILNLVSAFGFAAQTNVSNGNASNKKNLVYVTSTGGLLSAPSIDYGSYANSNSFNLNSASASSSSSSVYASFRPVAVVQYLDNNNNGKYDIGEEYSVTGLGFRSYNVDLTTSTVSGTKVTIVSYDAGDFGFRYSVQNRVILNQGVKTDEDSIKIDIWIRPTNKAQSNGKVALIATYSSLRSDSSLGGSANNGNVTVNGNGNIKYTGNGDTAGLSWASSARYSDQNNNGGDTKVTADVLTISASASVTINGVTIVDARAVSNLPRMLVFNFDASNPSEIYWDPSLGSGGSASSIVISMVAVILALALVM